jgi:hypothetical protein
MGRTSRRLTRLDAGHAPALVTAPSQVERRLIFFQV